MITALTDYCNYLHLWWKHNVLRRETFLLEYTFLPVVQQEQTESIVCQNNVD